ncbi:MAG: peptidoglycan-binding protein [Clostridia bacterium]|nr:peptidoglycan-binding protein [Clostridia bacterium]
MIRVEDRAAAIYEIQAALRDISRRNDSIRPRLIPDGIFGAETEAAVISFQRLVGVNTTGIVDFVTWTEIFNY